MSYVIITNLTHYSGIGQFYTGCEGLNLAHNYCPRMTDADNDRNDTDRNDVVMTMSTTRR